MIAERVRESSSRGGVLTLITTRYSEGLEEGVLKATRLGLTLSGHGETKNNSGGQGEAPAEKLNSRSGRTYLHVAGGMS